MKHYEQVTVPETTREICRKKTCDMCGGVHTWNDVSGDGWETQSLYHVLNTTVSLEEGTSYPGSHSTETLACDICPKCFRDVLVPFLESRGVKMRKEENDW